jgi:hypothetical protein
MKETITHQGKIVEVVQFEVEVEPGKFKTFEKARRAPGTRLIIPTTIGVLLTKEYRHETNGYDYRLPGGKVFDTLDEYNAFLATGDDILVPATAKAKAEAKEEAGVVTDDLKHFHTSVCGATVDWDLYYFVVGDHTREDQATEQGEDIEVMEVDRQEAEAMCLDGRISEERSALVLLRYLKESA